MIRLYQYPMSGNCYKIRLLFSHLGLRYEKVDVDLRAGEQKSPKFLDRFPLGKVPGIELDDGSVLAESNAILFHFAEGTPYLPSDKLSRARVMQWLFWEQYGHEPYLAVLRAWRKYFGPPKGREAEMPHLEAKGYAALDVMEKWLKSRPFFEKAYSIADISLFAYTHLAEEGQFELKRFPSVLAWMDRVRSQKGFVPLA